MPASSVHPRFELRRSFAGWMPGEIDAWAANKQRLTEMISGAGGFRIVPESFLAVGQSMVVAKGNQRLLKVVDQFLEDALRSGMVRKALNADALSGVEVAPVPAR
jgi:hypothetical protein